MMENKSVIISTLLLMLFSWTSAQAQNQEDKQGNQENSLNKLLNMLNNLTDEQKAYARAN